MIPTLKGLNTGVEPLQGSGISPGLSQGATLRIEPWAMMLNAYGVGIRVVRCLPWQPADDSQTESLRHEFLLKHN